MWYIKVKSQKSPKESLRLPTGQAKIKGQKGVSVYIAFLVACLVLAMALGISAILFSQIKMTGEIGDSVISLSTADSGIEKTFFYDRKVIPVGGKRGLCYMCNPANPNRCPPAECLDCTLTGPGCAPLTCTNCTISYHTTPTANMSYYVTSTIVTSGSDTTTTIKSIGIYFKTRRGIEVLY
jgi:hypothetical protein